ncbi:MAG TPA: hypothetical protein VH255_10415 [Verrucomicrobiae bacterium]|jgi:hypothetical protein|nr:hypothetical protein [Verrucomicrobiae bacterium]
MTTAKTETYFHALGCFYCKRNRFYRIFIRTDELIFIWAGFGGEGLAAARALAASRGAYGATTLVGQALTPILDPTKKNNARIDILNHTPLEQLIGDHPDNFRASITDFEEVRIRPRTDAHAQSFADHNHQARLFFKHRTLGKYRFGIASLTDTQIALKELPRIFGDKCHVEIPWPEQEQKCTCRFCRMKKR